MWPDPVELRSSGGEEMAKSNKGAMTVSDAGRKGGETTSSRYGHEFYEEIGHKGGQKVKKLIEEGKKAAK